MDESTRLSAQVEEFQAWIDSLPGKVPVEVRDGSFLVALRRDGNAWPILVDADENDQEATRTTLVRAPIAMKARAARLLPKLVAELLAMQKSLATQATSARAALDGLFETIGLEKKRS